MNPEIARLKEVPSRALLIGIGFIGLGLSFLFQEHDILGSICNCALHPYIHFAVRKFSRVLLNDTCMLLIIHTWFGNGSITKLAWMVQLIDTLVLLPVYLIIKLYTEGDGEISTPLLSQLHRLIVNPTLMILIIPGVYFQRLRR